MAALNWKYKGSSSYVPKFHVNPMYCVESRRGRVWLKVIRSLTGNQWKLNKIGVMWSDLEIMVTNLAAAFWTRCNLPSSQDGKPYKIELQESSFEVINAWTSLLQTSCVKFDRILPILRIADHAHLQTWFTWFFSSKCESISKPRSRTLTGFGTMITWSVTISWIGSKFLAWQDLRCTTSVLSRLQASPLLVHRVKISMMYSWPESGQHDWKIAASFDCYV